MPEGAPRKVTRRDVARHAGVSDAVVTYTLNGRAPVAPATAARVRESIRILGYTPNAAARALKMGSSRLIGIIVPDTTNPFWSELCQQVENVAAREGYAVLVVNSRDDDNRAIALARSLASRQVDGFLVASIVHPNEVTAFNALGIRWATLNNPHPIAGTMGVGVDLDQGARDATRHLIDHGYRRIAFVGSTKDARYGGWTAELASAGLEPGLVFPADFERRSGYLAGRNLAAASAQVDAVFMSSDQLAIGAMRALHEAGVDMPGDVAVVSFDGTDDAEYAWPGLTTLAQPIAELAEQAVFRLLGVGSIPDERPRGELIIRRSCGCE
ncbi:LacI family transcriptional regulator [Pseudoclavibacter sp. RFBJ3]|uniref:LacI family DNA-binding transcriptional regulator n=1 Tax=unclassified Pseudoclavibacter TaxID=2615177 RepID=UPI000CE7BAB4|nr:MULTISPECIES: LacI family DNA-binding transcriptional regulator [unclassified Pseudoclavibacter]PPF86416.1 LacI family transcriptional regulator [Pseudoclavibacter sp. RFBJ5]PPF95148.1 LacI family transcriptional regulator [Pseudoclavibacter sp. RFBJ3]PPF97583.1 LacI family transcriptional regulator [Pseudoclavibacter sp. RFBH5]PPG22763.1 LacI family transcriptional regulator [Pseudoclavibacter sp. RFBI4]